MLQSKSEINMLKEAVSMVDHPHQIDIKIAQSLKKHQSIYDAACYLRQFGWSLDSARAILLHGAGQSQ